MTAKEFLLQYGNTKAEIETLLDQIIAQREGKGADAVIASGVYRTLREKRRRKQ